MSKDEVKKKWVEALRSGRYEQCSGFLKVKSRGRLLHCCLGVLCEVAEATWDELEDGCYKYPRTSTGRELAGRELGGRALLSVDGRALVGMSSSQASVLMEMNDVGTPFSEIADWVEANLGDAAAEREER